MVHQGLLLRLVELFHLEEDAEGDLVGVLGLSVVVEELAIGVDQVDDDGVVHDVVLVLVLRARREVYPALMNHFRGEIQRSTLGWS